jgi:acyl-CoA synthetase (AMP-forming)/AMP-acid ligase II
MLIAVHIMHILGLKQQTALAPSTHMLGIQQKPFVPGCTCWVFFLYWSFLYQQTVSRVLVLNKIFYHCSSCYFTMFTCFMNFFSSTQGRMSPQTFRPPKPEDIATICYTSGTTGTPKVNHQCFYYSLLH